MKKIFVAALVSLSLFASIHAQAQTDPAPADTNAPAKLNLWDHLTTGSNYWAVPFGTFAPNANTFGAGIAIGYHATEAVNPVLRLEEFGGHWYMPSLTAQLQPPRYLLGKFPVTPFGIAGAGTPIAGGGDKNGTFVTIVGAGAYSRLDFLGSSKWFQHAFAVADVEMWLGLPQKQQKQVRFGVGFSF